MNTALAPDCAEFVVPGDEMWLDHILAKVNAVAYSTVEHFMADLEQIAANSEAYHSPGRGKEGNLGESMMEGGENQGGKSYSMVSKHCQGLNLLGYLTLFEPALLK